MSRIRSDRAAAPTEREGIDGGRGVGRDLSGAVLCEKNRAGGLAWDRSGSRLGMLWKGGSVGKLTGLDKGAGLDSISPWD